MGEMDAEFLSRNQGYISDVVQEKLGRTHLLIAGCGVGSQVAIAAGRLGIRRFTLVDGDSISPSNLNRQAFLRAQVGSKKVQALAQNLLDLNPHCQIRIIEQNLGSGNLRSLGDIDLIIDTIDFLDLKAIVLLHEFAESRKIPLLSGMTAGWGACAMYFSNQNGEQHQFRKLFGVDSDVPLERQSYVEKYQRLFVRLQGEIDPQVVAAMNLTFQKMADGEACAAPQVVSGAYVLAALLTTIVARLAAGTSVPEAPRLMNIDLVKQMQNSTVDLEVEP